MDRIYLIGAFLSWICNHFKARSSRRPWWPLDPVPASIKPHFMWILIVISSDDYHTVFRHVSYVDVFYWKLKLEVINDQNVICCLLSVS